MLIPYTYEPKAFPTGTNVSYNFHTKRGHKYGITFIEAIRITELLDELPVISNAIYISLDIIEQNGPLSFDCQIGKKVVEIIKDYLSNVGANCILVFNCSIDEGKQVNRNNKFNRWFNSFASGYNFEKIDRKILEPIDNGYVLTYISLLFVTTHPRKTVILEEIEKLTQSIGVDKPT